nr:reverse transcriptase domain-containing protein [Tanacetum cinerariifolium]
MPQDGYPLSEIDWKGNKHEIKPLKVCLWDEGRHLSRVQGRCGRTESVPEQSEGGPQLTSRALQGPEINYTSMEKLILALYRPRTSVKGQILANFIVERPEDDTPDTSIEDREELSDPWILFTDGSSCIDGFEAGLIITNPKGMEFTYALRFRFNATNNEAEYEALIAGLRIAGQMGANYVLREIHEGSCNMHAGPRSMVAKSLRSCYYWPTMHTNAGNLIRECNDCQVHRPVPRNPQKKLTPITSPWLFYKWEKDIAGPFSESPGKVKFLIVVMDYFTKWKEARPVATITGAQVKKFVWDNIVCRFGLSGEIVSDNEKQFRDNPFKNCLDLLEEKREQAAIQEARSKTKMERYYNARVRSTSFRPGDFVYQNNEASHAKDGGNLRPKWEGPYEATEALGKGAYRLRDRNGHTLLRTWNIYNLKKCYMHEM